GCVLQLGHEPQTPYTGRNCRLGGAGRRRPPPARGPAPGRPPQRATAGRGDAARAAAPARRRQGGGPCVTRKPRPPTRWPRWRGNGRTSGWRPWPPSWWASAGVNDETGIGEGTRGRGRVTAQPRRHSSEPTAAPEMLPAPEEQDPGAGVNPNADQHHYADP